MEDNMKKDMSMKDKMNMGCCGKYKMMFCWLVSTAILIAIVHPFLHLDKDGRHGDKDGRYGDKNGRYGDKDRNEYSEKRQDNFSYLAPGSREVSNLSDREYIKHIVDRTVRAYEKNGTSIFTKLNSPTYLDGEWYVFGITPQATRVFHPVEPEEVNQSIIDLEDSRGEKFVPRIISDSNASPDGVWSSYYHVNPKTGKEQKKTAYLVQKNNNIIFGAGYYSSK